MKQTKGSENQGYGLVWGSIGWEDSFEFIITSSGYYSIGGYKKSKYFAIKEWTKSTKINLLGRYNIIAIEKDGINLNFFINNEQVHTCRFKKFNGQVHGFILKSNITAVVDYYKITTEPRTIDVANTIFSDKVKENLGTNINSEYSDHSPVISSDESILIFTSRRKGSTGGKIASDNYFYEDIYIYDKNLGTDAKPVKISTSINTEYHEATCGLSFNGKELFIYRAVEKSEGDIYSSKLQDGKWEEPKKLNNIINTDARESHASVSADNKYLYFTSNRKGGIGGMDIYVAERNSEGEWSNPKNLGTPIFEIREDVWGADKIYMTITEKEFIYEYKINIFGVSFLETIACW